MSKLLTIIVSGNAIYNICLNDLTFYFYIYFSFIYLRVCALIQQNRTKKYFIITALWTRKYNLFSPIICLKCKFNS